MDEHENIVGCTISFRIRGDDYEVKPRKFAEWLNCDNEDILNTLFGWTLKDRIA